MKKPFYAFLCLLISDFFLSKLKRFGYNFCSRTRNFIKLPDCGRRGSRRVRKRGRRNGRRRGRNRYSSRNGGEQSMFNKGGSVDDLDRIDGDRRSNLKKGYLKNRQLTNGNTTATSDARVERASSKPISADEKHELMGKLW